MTDLVIAVTSNEVSDFINKIINEVRLHCFSKQNILPYMFQTRVVAAASIKTKDVKCRSNSSVRAAKLVVCRKSRLPQAERPAVMNYTSNEGSLHPSTPGKLYINAFLAAWSVFLPATLVRLTHRHHHNHCSIHCLIILGIVKRMR